MYGIATLILLPLFGWWLIRATRAIDRLAGVINENAVDLGFHSFKGKTSSLLLFSDVRFSSWLVRAKYRSLDVPPSVIQALEEGRTSYLLLGGVMLLIIVAGFAIALSGPLT